MVSAYRDLREWISKCREMGGVREVEGAHWDLEIGSISALLHRKKGLAGLFSHIPGYPSDFHVLTNPLGNLGRFAFTANMPLDLKLKDSVRAWREKTSRSKLIPPKYVNDGPVMENVITGNNINMWMFPTPRWHEKDGGRYIGTASVDITRDRETGWVNLGTYRVMVKDEKHLCFYISPGKDGLIHRQQYFGKNEPCPVAVSLGHDPILYLVGGLEVPYGTSEYDYAGGLREEPIEVLKGPVTGLPLPARAEIVIEGYARKDLMGEEGPFGEWTGYYASSARMEPLIEVKAIYHRNHPILLGTYTGKPPAEPLWYRTFTRAALIQEELEKAGVPDVVNVWCHEAGGTRLFTVVSIRQRYAGHARQAGMLASYCRAGSYLGRFVIVVDEDIDVIDLNQIIWAISTRCDPEKDIDILRRCRSGPLDSVIPVGEKGFNTRAVIDATRPWEWKDRFPEVADLSPELQEKTEQKWGHVLD